MNPNQKANVLVTGLSGALGSHVRLRLLQLNHEPHSLELRQPALVPQEFNAVIHLAGINRGSEEELATGNFELARQLTDLLDQSGIVPEALVFANSAQSLSGDSPYAKGKRAAAEHLEAWCGNNGVRFKNHFLPNLIGEFGKPFSNMVSSTIVHQIALSQDLPEMNNSSFQVATLQAAAEAICNFGENVMELNTSEVSAAEVLKTARVVWGQMMDGVDSQGNSEVESRIWGMLVSERFNEASPQSAPAVKADPRGEFVEIGRRSTSDSQVSLISFSPGAVRGNHFHRYLIEDFHLVEGLVKVDFGRAWKQDDDDYSVTLRPGEQIRFPIGWWHRITDLANGSSKLLVLANQLFDPENPDTIPWRG